MMTAQLAADLARGDAAARLVDPRSQPVRFHHLKAMGRSAAHCFESFQADGESTLARRIGAGAHALAFGQRVAVWDQPAKKGIGKAKRSGAAWTAFEAEHAGQVILNRKEHERALRIATSLTNHDEASRLLFGAGAVHEQTIFWSQLGRSRRSTPDCRGPGYVAELKTTRCASPEMFRHDVRRMAYHAQVADQRRAIEDDTGELPSDAFIIAVETAPPFVVQTFRITPRDIEHGERVVRLWLESFIAAELAGVWSGYCESTVDLDLGDPDDLDLIFADDDPGIDEQS